MIGSWLSSVALLRARGLHEFTGPRMPSFEQSTALRWNADEEPDLVLFISHRWRTAAHPDPDGGTLRTIARVLAALDCLARGLDPTCDASVPTLRSPAMLHASVLLHRLMHRFDGDGASALDRVAIFYDFSCMAQAGAPEHLERLKNGLASFPTMIPDRRVALLALRQPRDDYESRAWCVAESVLSLNYEADRPWADTFPLRIDLEPRGNVVAFEPLEAAIDAWSRDVCVPSRITSARFRDWLELVQLCVDWYGQSRAEATARLHHSSSIAEHSFRLWLTTTIRLAEAGDSVVDIGPLLRGVLPEAGRDFWRQCLSRFLEGRPLRAEVRLRESRLDGALSAPSLSLVPD